MGTAGTYAGDKYGLTRLTKQERFDNTGMQTHWFLALNT